MRQAEASCSGHSGPQGALTLGTWGGSGGGCFTPCHNGGGSFLFGDWQCDLLPSTRCCLSTGMQQAGEGCVAPQTEQETEGPALVCSTQSPLRPPSACYPETTPSGRGPCAARYQPPCWAALAGVRSQPFQLGSGFYIWTGRGSAHGNEGPGQGGELLRPGRASI